MRIPASYLPTSIDEQANTVSDGKVGTAYIQELRFNRYCERLQATIVESFDREFKLWLLHNGYNIDSSLFELKFNPPQNFAAYRQAELDTTRANIYQVVQQVPHLSKRFAMKRYLGLNEEEIKENERLWREENQGNLAPPSTDAAGELRTAGITPGGIAADTEAQSAEADPGMAAQAEEPAGGADAETPAQ